MPKNNSTSEPDNVIPSDEQAAEMIAARDADQAPASQVQAPDTAGHPYGDGSYSEGHRKSLDRLIKSTAYGGK